MDGLIAVAMSSLLIGVSVLAHLKYWAVFWAGITVWLGIMEVWAKHKTGMTLSQQFWAEKKEHPIRTLIVFEIYALFFVFLLMHLIGIM